ncbi:PHD finger protein MALE MEIOCYTE DEATH 1 [Amaranthus tricolor]|uniref:PHD finger protein MALE MEIOCYTE DEATH 1 n=1 Tax=Amaranthus tricolor TaxID=29722 RepID=UPI00258B7BD1|nr:PHD finger protein MALE MEIOCYTE DEATH 1 [Amaranthus tricolor]
MSLPILKTLKKKKRAPKLFNLNTFCDPGCPIQPNGAFRDNVREFLQECAEIEDYKLNSMNVWCTLLVHESRHLVIPLYTIEEDVKLSKNPFCDLCRCTGWSHHYLSRRKYHMIIPLDSEWNKPLNSEVLELQTHLLHGMIHCNGFGHILCINGIEGGSKYLCGREIMDLWDRVCTNLHTRKISVEDTSRKRSMDLRLLHGVAYGHTWFGRWGYKFCHGSFGVQEHHFQKALDVLSSLTLDDLVSNSQNTNKWADVKRIINSYRNLSKTSLITLKDLLRFMLMTLKSSKTSPTTKFPSTKVIPSASAPQNPTFPTKSCAQNRQTCSSKAKPVKCRNFTSLVASLDSRWPKRRLEFTADIIVNTLKANRECQPVNKGMTRQEVRDVARAHIGDTGLLDFVLKSMNNVIVGDHIVRRRIDPLNRILHYTIQKVGEPSPSPEKPREQKSYPNPPITITPTSGSSIYQDIYTLYQQLLFDLPESEISSLSVRVTLDSKHFEKEWPFKDQNDQLLRFICHFLPTSDMESSYNHSPGELIVLPLHASVRDLKAASQQALRDTYCIMESYMVTSIDRMESYDNEEVIFGALESGSEIWVRGKGIDSNSEWQFVGGPDNWTVKCSCGAKDDDGERMVSCDICEVWQHTRCSGIEDTETVPPLFVCKKCCSSLMPPRAETISFSGNDICQDLLIMPQESEFEDSWMEFTY